VLGALACVAAAGCSASSTPGSQATAGAGGGGSGGAAGMGGGGAAGAVDGGPDAAAAEVEASAPCELAPRPRRTTGATLALEIAPVYAAVPLAFGESAETEVGSLTTQNFRFYVSEVVLGKSGGSAVPVDIVTESGTVVPYGVHLYNAEEPAARTLRVLAPPGTYTSVSFTLGLLDSCNAGDQSAAQPPLAATSQMTWPQGLGYLFLRFEARIGASADGGTAPLSLIHMGGLPTRLFAPVVRAPAASALPLTAGQTLTRTLRVDLREIVRAAATDLAPGSVMTVLQAPEVLAGERLRQHASDFPIFVIVP
jgi:hypothetical protein